MDVRLIPAQSAPDANKSPFPIWQYLLFNTNENGKEQAHREPHNGATPFFIYAGDQAQACVKRAYPMATMKTVRKSVSIKLFFIFAIFHLTNRPY